MEKKLLLVVNPISGHKTGMKVLGDVLALFCRAGYTPTVFITAGPGDGCNIVRERAKDHDLVVCLGGDGTFNEMVSGLLSSGVERPVGYIPCGSTNDFAASIHLNKNPLQAARDIIEGVPVPYDVGQFDGRYFTYVASFGAFTRASYATPQPVKNVLGHLAYVLEGIKDIPSIRPIHLRLETGGTVLEDDYIFGAISNSTSMGGVLTLDPETVDMADGVFEMLLVRKPANAFELSECIRALQEKKYNCAMISFTTTDRVTVTTDAAVDWSLDGEHQAADHPVEVVNLHHAIHLLSPKP